jgi:hypothetical protein
MSLVAYEILLNFLYCELHLIINLYYAENAGNSDYLKQTSVTY